MRPKNAQYNHPKGAYQRNSLKKQYWRHIKKFMANLFKEHNDNGFIWHIQEVKGAENRFPSRNS